MRILLAVAFFVVASVALFVGFLVVLRVVVDTDGPDCDRVALPQAADWAALSGPDRSSLAGDLSLCSRFDGLTAAELVEHFGAPDRQGTQGDGSGLVVYLMPDTVDPTDTDVTYDDELRLTVVGDRVTDVMIVDGGGGD